jgi:hypothetical protein
VGGIGGGRSPTEGSMPGHQDCGNRIRIDFGERAADGFTSLEFVVGGNLLGSESLRDWNRSVEIVRVCRPEARDGRFGLSPGGGEFRMGVSDATDIREVFLELEVRG